MNKTTQSIKHIISYIENRQLTKEDSLPTLRDIAATCGVSLFIAKKAIEHLKEFDIIDSKWGSGNYINDNSSANLQKALDALSKQQHKTGALLDPHRYIAFIGKGRSPIFFGGYLTGIYNALIPENYQLILEMSNNSITSENETINRLLENKAIKGIIIDTVNKSKAPQYLPLLQQRNIPHIFIGDCDFGEDFQETYIQCDNRAGFTETMNHLYEMGHRQIAYVGTPRYDLPANLERYKTYKEFMIARNLQELYLTGSGGEPSEEFITEIRNSQCLKRKITAFACCGDSIAKEVIDSCLLLNLKVPSDISVIGFDSRHWTAHYAPALTSIKYPNEEIGRVAAYELFKIINDPINHKVQTIKVKPHIIIRNSVKKI